MKFTAQLYRLYSVLLYVFWKNLIVFVISRGVGWCASSVLSPNNLVQGSDEVVFS